MSDVEKQLFPTAGHGLAPPCDLTGIGETDDV